jgi:uncharacterized protein YmfQ (DUF2313 family)
MDANAYARMLKRLMPQGVLWDFSPESVISTAFLACGDEFARVEARGADLIEETDPRTATETLEDWERMLGLPDEDVVEFPATDAGRRLAIVAKFIRRGGQTPAYYLRLAAACGYDSDQNYVTEGYAATVARVNRTRCQEPIRNAPWAHVWEMTIEVPGLGTFLTQDELEAIIRRAAPAHTVVVFNYL